MRTLPQNILCSRLLWKPAGRPGQHKRFYSTEDFGLGKELMTVTRPHEHSSCKASFSSLYFFSFLWLLYFQPWQIGLQYLHVTVLIWGEARRASEVPFHNYCQRHSLCNLFLPNWFMLSIHTNYFCVLLIVRWISPIFLNQYLSYQAIQRLLHLSPINVFMTLCLNGS